MGGASPALREAQCSDTKCKGGGCNSSCGGGVRESVSNQRRMMKVASYTLLRGTARDAIKGKAPRGRPQRCLDRRLEEVSKAVGGGYCREQMP